MKPHYFLKLFFSCATFTLGSNCFAQTGEFHFGVIGHAVEAAVIGAPATESSLGAVNPTLVTVPLPDPNVIGPTDV